MIIVKVGEPKIKNVDDVWFDPTTKVSQKAIPFGKAGTLLWMPIQPSFPFPLYPHRGDIHVDLTGVPSLWDGNGWIPAVPNNYNYPPPNPSPGTQWIEPMSQTQYVFHTGKWCEVLLVGANSNIPLPIGTNSSPLVPNNTFEIVGPSGFLVRFDAVTGVLTYGPGYTPDAAAQIFWRALAGTSPRFLQTRIEELVIDLKNITSRLAVAEGQVLRFTQAGYKLREPLKPFDPNESWERAMGIIK